VLPGKVAVTTTQDAWTSPAVDTAATNEALLKLVTGHKVGTWSVNRCLFEHIQPPGKI